MTQLILDSTQTQIVLQAHDEVRFCDAAGNVLGVLVPAPIDSPPGSATTDEEVAPHD